MEYLTIFSIAVAFVLTYLRHIRTEPGYDTYMIKKGKHYSIRNRSIISWKFGLAKKTLRFEAIFSDGCDYEDNSNGDINKLFGVSYNATSNHKNSVRIGWKYNENLKIIELYTYAYIKGKRIINHLMNVKQYEPVFFTIFNVKKVVRISVSDEEKTERKIDAVKDIDTSWLRLKQYPYYGGDHKSPNDMKIFIREY